MIKWIVILLMLFSTNAYGAFIECHDGGGSLVKPSEPGAICVLFSGHTTGIDAHDRVRDLKKTVPRHYIKWTTEPVEMTQGEKDAVDAQLQADRILAFKQRVKDSIDADNEEGLVRDKAIAWIIYKSLMETRNKINEIISTSGINVDPLPNRTWPQLKGAVKNEIDSPKAA